MLTEITPTNPNRIVGSTKRGAMKTVIVSAYFDIPSKHPHGFYLTNLKRFFRSMQAPLIFYTTSDVESEIRSWGFDLNHTQINVIEFSKLTAFTVFDSNFWMRQKERDPESYHTPELAAIWFEKKEFVKRAMQRTTADVFIWCDAGCVRDDYSEIALRSFGLRNRVILNNGRLHLIQIQELPKKGFYSYPDVGIACGFQSGNRQAWTSHTALYDTSAREYDAVGTVSYTHLRAHE